MVHGRGVASIRDIGRHLNHAGSHAHRGRSIQPGSNDAHATDQSTGALIFIISPGGTDADQCAS